ncbi:MAG: sulfite exporter TauE/SafE family protein [Bacteroidales bacterium]
MESLLTTLQAGLSLPGFLLFLLVALCIGMAKAGFGGLGLAVVPVMAILFGPRESTGVILPMLITADILAVIHYRQNAEWKYIIRVLPWVAGGILTGLITGRFINPGQFRILLLGVVWIMLALMVINDIRAKRNEDVPHNVAFPAAMGFSGGFATMIGNAAGPVFTLYFLSMKLRKNEFIGTGAWLYLIMNTGKLPLQAIVWKNISAHSLFLDLIAIPFIAAGVYLGIYLVRLFPEKVYRYFIIFTTIATSALLLL